MSQNMNKWITERRDELCFIVTGSYFSSLKHDSYLNSFLLCLLIIKWSSHQTKTTNIKPAHYYALVTETFTICVVKPLTMVKCFSFQPCSFSSQFSLKCMYWYNACSHIHVHACVGVCKNKGFVLFCF